ncbi:MAG: exodeoxyribonuclease VII large subunit [Candidatus Aenigmarchaeota archaeon]|nr:exodeoxyribonuclease VII large subunit [Candidatus Aenigmarchaeota archaeon]
MLTDKSLMKLSFIVSATGIIALFVFVQFIEPKQITAAELENNIGNVIVISGAITSYSESKGSVFVDLDNSTKIVMFSTEAERKPDVYRLKAGDNIFVTGKVQLYRGTAEIIAKSIRKV